MNRDLQIAEAVRDACEAMHETEDVLAPIGNSAYGEAYQDGWIEGTEAYRAAIQTANLQSIISSIPAPEPVAWIVGGNIRTSLSELDSGKPITKLYTAPPAAEINRQLLAALKEIVEISNKEECESPGRPNDFAISWARLSKICSIRAEAAAAITAAEKELKYGHG